MFTFDSRYLNHSSHYDVIVAISNIINIDVDFVSPSCTLPSRVWGCARLARIRDTSDIESTFCCLTVRWHAASSLAGASTNIVCDVEMWQGQARSRCRCGRVEPNPGADVAGLSPIPVQMWQG